jgi:NAD(P)-dependent dehydrogenase (short-subunit alcohol dehydrogenase family)
MDYELWAELLRINTFGPVRMAEAFMTNISNSHERKIVCLSSSVGSIESRRTPAISYPSTKAALNKTVSLISDQLKNQGIICVSICPGHVKTRMGVGGAELEIEDSVSGMRGVIEGLTLADSGTFIRYNGERVPW